MGNTLEVLLPDVLGRSVVPKSSFPLSQRPFSDPVLPSPSLYAAGCSTHICSHCLSGLLRGCPSSLKSA